MGRKEGWVPELATHRHHLVQKLFSLHLNLIRQRLQDHFANLIKVIQLILGGSRSMLATGPAFPLVLSGKSQGLTYLLVVLHLLQLVEKVGNLDHLDRILVVHVSAQEIHFLLGLLDLVIQLLHLLLQVWRSQRETGGRTLPQGPLPGFQEAKLSLANELGSGLKRAHTGWRVVTS